MGFFSDLKEDLSQAVNELLPDTEETSETKETETPKNVETTVWTGRSQSQRHAG